MKTNIFYFPLTRIILFFIGGILLSYYAIPKEAVPKYAVIGVMLIIVFLSFTLFIHQKWKVASTIILCLCSCYLGIINQLLHEPCLEAKHYVNMPFEAARSTTILIRERLKPSDRNLRYYALVQQIDAHESSGKVALTIKRKGIKAIPAIGDIIIVTDPIALHRKPFNPGQFDYGQYLADKHIAGNIYTRQEHYIIQKAGYKDLWYYADQVRTAIARQLKQKGMGKEELSVVMALILGQQQDISEGTIHDYQFAGAVHILSVSGLHIGFLMLFVQFLFSGLPHSRGWNILRFCMIMVLLWSFAFLSGLSPSVVRSATMFSFVAVGRLLKKDTNIYHTLLLSLFFILSFEPAFLFDAGFQLSYLSLFFIVWLQPLLGNLIKIKSKVGQYVMDTVSVSFAAQIGVLPLSLYYFHQFPGLFFITNLIILPDMGVIMALGTLTVSLAAFGCAPIILVKLLGFLIHLLNCAIGKIAGLTAFVIQDISLSKMMMLASYLIIFMAVMLAKKQNFRYYMAFFCSVLVWNICFFSENYTRKNQDALIVFQQARQTLLGFRKGDNADFFSSNIDFGKSTEAYILANGIKNPAYYPIRNIYSFKAKNIKLIDSTGIYTDERPDVLILSGSPKINLERYLSHHEPEIVIADGSDYKSYVKLWKESCRKRKIPFHATAEKGFYMME